MAYAAFKRALQQSLSWAELTQILLLTRISLRSILILSCHLRLDLTRGLFHIGLPARILKILIFFHSDYMLYPSQSSRFKHPDYIR